MKKVHDAADKGDITVLNRLLGQASASLKEAIKGEKVYLCLYTTVIACCMLAM